MLASAVRPKHPFTREGLSGVGEVAIGQNRNLKPWMALQ
jgi:hypothetical protein